MHKNRQNVWQETEHTPRATTAATEGVLGAPVRTCHCCQQYQHCHVCCHSCCCHCNGSTSWCHLSMLHAYNTSELHACR
jgi:hypothetical protein